jgi:hypothetical protein
MFLGVTIVGEDKDEKPMTVMACVGDLEEEVWIADTGASCTCTGIGENLWGVVECNKKVEMPNGVSLTATMIGNVSLKTEDDEIMLRKVHYVPGFKHNLVSIGSYTDQGYKLSGEGNLLTLAKDDESWTFTKEKGEAHGLFHLKGVRVNEHDSAMGVVVLPTIEDWIDDEVDASRSEELVCDEVAMIQTPVGKNKKKLDINYAHQVFGHADFGLVVKTCLELGWKLTGTPETCEACALAKAKAKKVN